MSAIVAINRLTGAGPTSTRIDTDGGFGSTRASTSDTVLPGILNPIPIPSSGSVRRSYWVVLRLETLTAPDGTIDNIRWYPSTKAWAGVTLEVGTATAYTQAAGTIGVTGNTLNVTNYPTLATTPAADNGFRYSSDLPLSISGSTTTAEQFGDYLVYQITVTPQASQGALTPLLMTFSYDET